MKSTLKIDLNGSNEPVIVAKDESYGCEDLRDKVLNRFFTSLYGHFSPVTSSIEVQEESHLCFVELAGVDSDKAASPIYYIHPIIPGQEDRYINRLQLSQAERIIKLAFQMFGATDRYKILKNLQDMDKEFGGSIIAKGLINPQEIGAITGKRKK